MASLPTLPTNSLTANGLTLVTQATWLAFFTAVFQGLYGSDVILTQDTPDGQLINIVIQAILDNQDLTQQVYSSFDPTQAIGTTLDQRLGLVGIKRLGGTFSQVGVTINTSQAITLFGLNQTAQPVYTLSDSSGNSWQLLNTITTAQGTNLGVIFQASLPGPINTTVNSITTQVSSVTGVASVTNPQVPFLIGTSEETDAAAKLRLSQSRQAYFTTLYTALGNISGVTSINIEENDTKTNNPLIPDTGTASDGDNSNSIWVIIGGSPDPSSIANAIYQNRTAGAGMVGSTSFTVTRPDGSTFVVYWDQVQLSDLYVEMWLQSINGITPPAVANIQNQLSAASTFLFTATFASASTSMVINGTIGGDVLTNIAKGQLIQGAGIADNTFVTGVSVSNGVTTVSLSNPTTAPGTTEQVSFFAPGLLIPGIGSTLNINQVATLVQEIDPNSLVSWSGNSFTGGLQIVPVGQSYSQGAYQNIIFPGNPAAYTAQQQPILTPIRTIVYPMIIGPDVSAPNTTYALAVSGANVNATITVANSSSNTQQFSEVGGLGPFAYALTTNNSGGNCTSDGLYTPGVTASVQDVVTVTDTTGVTAIITINVVT